MCLLNNAAKHSKLQQKMIEGMEHGPYDDGCEKIKASKTDRNRRLTEYNFLSISAKRN